MKISQSTLGNVDKCLRSAQYTLDTPGWYRRDTSGARAVGTGYHAGLQLGYECREEGGTAKLEDIVDVAQKTFLSELKWDHYTDTAVEIVLWSDKVPDEITGLALVKAMLHEYYQKGHEWPEDWAIIGVEHPFKIRAKDNLELASNGIDLLVESPDKSTLVGVDHKTAGKAWDQGKSKPRKSNQAPMMTWAMRQIWPGYEHYRFCFDIMTYGLKFERRISDPTPAHEEAIIAKASQFAFMYETIVGKAGMDLPANPGSNLCNPRFCGFFSGCPHGAALDT